MNTRRQFLQKISYSAIALPFVDIFKTEGNQPSEGPKKNDRVLRVALMGLGSYATRVAEAMVDCKRAHLTGLISGTPSKLIDWQQRYGIAEKNCYNYENFDAIKDNPAIDVVYVITPNSLHHDQVIRAAQAGKHVICEKPMAVTANQGQQMIEACKKANVKLLVGYRMHFEPKTLEIIRMRREGELGKVMFFQGLCGFKIGDPHQWRLNPKLSGGGSLMDIGIYGINGARYMIGEEPRWVRAQATKTDTNKFKEGVDETIQIQLGFPGGAVASLLSTYNMNNLDRFFLNGENGFAELQPATNYGPIKGRTHKGELIFPHIAHQTVQMDEMAAILLDGKTPTLPVDGEEALRDLIVMDAVYQACQSGKKIEIHPEG
ncbi:MAG: Gfo/Idh/MocA family oxidoreductase [Flavisolibacter sp.]